MTLDEYVEKFPQSFMDAIEAACDEDKPKGWTFVSIVRKMRLFPGVYDVVSPEQLVTPVAMDWDRACTNCGSVFGLSWVRNGIVAITGPGPHWSCSSCLTRFDDSRSTRIKGLDDAIRTAARMRS